jgi:predicted nucleic acid-binding protein
LKLLDTSVAIDHLRGRPEATAFLEGIVMGKEALVASEVVRFELVALAVAAEELAALDAFFAAIDWVPVSEEVARTAGDLARRFRRNYAGIGDADYLIGATAVVLGAELITTNVRHFPMFEGLRPPY